MRDRPGLADIAATRHNGMVTRPATPALDDRPLAPGLYLVATPIGNLRDITLRALDTLAGVDAILAEDTRVTGKLLSVYGVSKPMWRYDEHAAVRTSPKALQALADGGRLALVSDAGTPLVSDPGYRLAREAIAAGHLVYAVPGASAVLAALSVAGLPTDRFLFAGFPPPKTTARRKVFEDLATIPATLVFYEGASRVAESLADMAAVFGDRPAAVARELTKLHEECRRGGLAALAADPAIGALKGEFVILVGPAAPAVASPVDVDAALADALARLSTGEAATEVARRLGVSRREVYQRALALKNGG